MGIYFYISGFIYMCLYIYRYIDVHTYIHVCVYIYMYMSGAVCLLTGPASPKMTTAELT